MKILTVCLCSYSMQIVWLPSQKACKSGHLFLVVFPSYCWNLILAQQFLICVDCNFLPFKGENIIKQ